MVINFKGAKYMKKIFSLFVLASLFLTSNTVFASEIYSQKLAVVKNSKSAKQKVVNAKIKQTNKDIKRTIENPDLSEKEKNRRLTNYQNKLIDLKNQKTKIKEQYKKDKAELKAKYN